MKEFSIDLMEFTIDLKESSAENEARAKGKAVQMLNRSQEKKKIRRNTLAMRVAATMTVATA